MTEELVVRIIMILQQGSDVEKKVVFQLYPEIVRAYKYNPFKITMGFIAESFKESTEHKTMEKAVGKTLSYAFMYEGGYYLFEVTLKKQ